MPQKSHEILLLSEVSQVFCHGRHYHDHRLLGLSLEQFNFSSSHRLGDDRCVWRTSRNGLHCELKSLHVKLFFYITGEPEKSSHF